jgi:hypothetical protein
MQLLPLGLRTALGARRHRTFVRNVARALDLPAATIELLDLPRSDHARAVYERELKQATAQNAIFRRSWTEGEIENAIHALDVLQARIRPQPMLVLRAESRYCGAIATTSDRVLERAFHLVRADKDELRALTPDGSAGLLFECFTGWSRLPTYELRVWGAEWVSALPTVQPVISRS